MSKFWHGALLLSSLMVIPLAQAGVIVGATRVIYDGGKREASLGVSNPDKIPYLIQSWVEPARPAEKAPFLITPPLFRLEEGQNNILRIVQLSNILPQNKETLFWMNVKAIPSSERKDNTLEIAVNTRLKLIYRPAGLKNKIPEDVTSTLHWQRQGAYLQVNNPTPYYMNFQSVKVGGKEIADATYIEPFSTTRYSLPAGAAGNVRWVIINDFGGNGPVHQATL